MTTVAESIGGVMAVLAAFAVFRLQSLSSQIQSDLDKIADLMPTHPADPEGQKKERSIHIARTRGRREAVYGANGRVARGNGQQRD
jgi:hypothetical protein